MNVSEIGPLAAIDWLSTYFTEALNCRFFVGDVPVRAHEVFDEEGALYAFAVLADKRAQYLFNIKVVDKVMDSPAALMGYRVVLNPQMSALQMILLSQTAEEVFGVDPEVGGKEIDLEPIIEYLMLPPEQRTVEKCPWTPLKILN